MAAERVRVLYDGSPDIRALIGRLQGGECPLIEIEEDGAVVAASYAAIGDSGRLEAQLAMIAVRVEALLARAAAGVAAPFPDKPERAPVRFSRLLQWKRAARRLAGRVLAPLRRGALRRHWNIALRHGPGPAGFDGFDLDAFTPLPVDPDIFYADPFVIARDGRHYLFAEACPYATGKGVIVCAEVGADGAPGTWRAVLERPWHLSYPFVFEHGGEIWLAPESSSHGGIELYRATDFPYGWTFAERLLPELPLVDPTFFEHEGRLWLFAGMGIPGGSDWDELYAWHAPDLHGPWQAHALNPIKSDCRSARPGGRVIQLDGRLYRPAQRCERFYGEALVWLQIGTLTPGAFEEAEVALWRAEGPGLSGPHHADLSTSLSAVDFRSLLAGPA
ncbi:MAG TPA: hypothetical protein VLK25_07210 [Allosphingosinicella sp.]|nr:hypothetical protein [Allosphingosinicella sp.]